MVLSTGYCYSNSDVSSSNPHMVSFESNPPEIYNLTTGLEMTGYPPKNNNLQQQQPHPDFAAGVSDHLSTPWHDQNRSFLLDDSSLRCVFPCEGNERPSQGLSLSLSSTHPSTIGLQSFELRQQQQQQQQNVGFDLSNSSRDLILGKSMHIQDGFLGKSVNLHEEGQFGFRNSKYLGPVQELLNEFCNLGTSQSSTNDRHHYPPKTKLHKNNQWQMDENIIGSSSSKQQSLHSIELVELQTRKTKLLQMLEEVDRRYKHYCDQMKAVVSSFEAVAGNGAATVYSSLASTAMSRHFRCLRDGIVNQIKETKKAMGEKDTVTVGSTRGETPRLRVLDQTLRQQRALQQMSVMESHPWRPQRGLPERSVSVLRAWLFEHFLHPYPSDVDKHILARQTGLSRSQVSNWFINARVRLWKPMVEEMYMEETKEQDIPGTSDGITAVDDNPQTRTDDQKPTLDQLVRMDSECLSSIINNPGKKDSKISKSLQNDDQQVHHHQYSFGRIATADSFGAVELDFSSYNPHSAGNGNGGEVSLTLGLHQHSGSGGGGGSAGMSLAFSPISQNSLFYPRDHIEDCQSVQYSLLDGDQGQNLPYRNLMGAQLLHDMA